MALWPGSKKEDDSRLAQPREFKPAAHEDAGDLQPAEPAGEIGLENLLKPVSQKLDAVDEGIQQQKAAVADAFRELRDHLDGALERLAAELRIEEPDEDVRPPPSGDWERAIFGSELAEAPELDRQRRRLIEGLLSGDEAARSLAGQLLVFRSAPAERMPPLLKELGEAFYRWQPKNTSQSDLLENALVAWLEETCAAAGIPNTIELVHPSQRFDSTRHSAAAPGVEIAEVRGWIVLRAGGRVYSKAAVAVR